MKDQSNTPTPAGENRREFIKKTATATAAAATASSFITPVYGQNQAPSPGRVIGANDRIAVGYVGVGGQGMAHVRSQKEHAGENNIVQAAVCDVSNNRRTGAKDYIAGENVASYHDHREMMDRKDIDAIVIATVDHWHTQISLDAMNTGKHVYVEKPMTRYLGEAFSIYDAAKRTGLKLQVGSQGCADAKYHKAAELIRAGKIGPLVLGQGSYMRNNPVGEWNYDIPDWCTADDIDWNKWLGRVHNRVPFNPDHYRRWRKYYPYCAGLLGDLFPHRLHPLMLATGNPEFPTRVCSLGNKKVQTDRNTPGTYERDVPENVQLLAEFPSGLNLFVTSATVNEQGFPDIIRGHHGTLYFGGNTVELRPERKFADDIDPEDHRGLTPGESVAELEKNWFNCIRSGAEPFAGPELAIRVQTVISLGEMAERLSETLLFDEKTRAITNGQGKVIEPITYGSLTLS